MSVFERYAPWYDLLYGDKDYVGETDFVASRLAAAGLTGGKLLDLGCGTGIHALEFARRDWWVEGVDLSPQMIERATAATESAGLSDKVSFRQGDARSPRATPGEFDAVVSLFHVASYQTTEADLSAVAKSAWEALRPGGVFLFDYWHGPAVLSQRPEVRVREIEAAPLRVLRVARPHHDEIAKCVDVHYTVFFENLETHRLDRVDELHTMRYWYTFETEKALIEAGFSNVSHHAWMSDGFPTSAAWAAYSVGVKPA